jgi:hypothetical protein
MQVMVNIMNKRCARNFFWIVTALFFLISGGQIYSQYVVQSAGGSPLIINEFVASNGSGLVDEDGEFSDWIEVYNRSDRPINLSGWSLTDDPAAPDKWSFPNLTLDSGDYLVVFASGKNRKETMPGTELHTNFRLSREFSFLALHNVLDSRFLDVVSAHQANQVRDVAFGLNQDSMEFGYLLQPSPGSPNNDSFVPQEIGMAMEYTVRKSDPDLSKDALAQVLQSGEALLPLEDQLQITEIMYNPDGGDQYEFIELKNISSESLSIAGASFDGVDFTFPLTTPPVLPGQLLILASDESAFSRRYPGVEIAGVYGGQLSNQGETISLRGFDGTLLTSVSFDDERGWPLTPDGRGDSLVLVSTDGNVDNPLNWRASPELYGTPGAELSSFGATIYDTLAAIPGLQIFSFLATR